MADDVLLAELAAGLPDVPRWVEARGLLIGKRCEVLLGPEGKRGAGYLVLERDGPLACAVHRPVASLVAQLWQKRDLPRQILAPFENAESLRTWLPGWRELPCAIHVHPSPGSLPRPGHPARYLTLWEAQALEGAPAPLADELARALNRGPVAAAFDGEQPVAFSYAAYETERWFHLEIVTLPEFRRRGFASSAAGFLIQRQLERGRKPVWGTQDADTASLAMAAKYGFRAVDRMMVFVAPGAEDEVLHS